MYTDLTVPVGLTRKDLTNACKKVLKIHRNRENNRINDADTPPEMLKELNDNLDVLKRFGGDTLIKFLLNNNDINTHPTY
jgi:hypothetical protein